MATYTVEVGSKPVLTGQYHVGIDGVTTITIPTTAQGVSHAGILELILSVETQNARITFDGSTPSTTNGVLLAAPGILTIRGNATISAMKIIGAAAGGFINYAFTVDALV